MLAAYPQFPLGNPLSLAGFFDLPMISSDPTPLFLLELLSPLKNPCPHLHLVQQEFDVLSARYGSLHFPENLQFLASVVFEFTSFTCVFLCRTKTTRLLFHRALRIFGRPWLVLSGLQFFHLLCTRPPVSTPPLQGNRSFPFFSKPSIPDSCGAPFLVHF